MVAHNCHGKTKNLTAKTKTSRQNQKTHGKTKNLTAKAKYLTAKPKTSRQKQNTSRQNQKPHGKNKIQKFNSSLKISGGLEPPCPSPCYGPATFDTCPKVNFEQLGPVCFCCPVNRFSLGQISVPLRLTKESYCNLKLKCPDTGQHTVRDLLITPQSVQAKTFIFKL